MHDLEFLQDLAVVMIVAGLVTVIFHRLRQPVVLGYILAGVIIGPHTPPYPLVHDEKAIHTLSELGVILLMFGLGLEFSLRKLKQVGAAALIAALLEILLLFWVGYEVGRAFSWPFLDCVFLGAMLSMSSTTVIIKVLGDLGKMKEPFSQLIFGILIIEDVLGIAMIALMSGLAATGRLSVGDVTMTLAKLSVFLAGTLVAGLLFVPRLIRYVARFKSNEMLIVTVLGLCFGVSLLAAKLGYSVALGAFLIGAVMAEARDIHRVETLLEPVRDMFSAIFFVSIGLLIDPKMLVAYWLPILVITLAVVVGKVVACSFGAFVGGNDTRTSLRVGMGLAQIGEFSFIIATLGVALNVTGTFLFPVAVAVSAITTFLTPYLIRSADGFVLWFDSIAPPVVVNGLNVYSQRISQLLEGQSSNPLRAMVRKWSWQMALNLTLVAAVFLIARFVGANPPVWLEHALGERIIINDFLWLLALVFSLPLLIATFRKLQALGMLLGESAAKRVEPPTRATAVQTVITNAVPAAGVIGLALFLSFLSSTLMPSGWRLIALVIVLVALTALLWRFCIRIYSKAQVTLRETFTAPPPAPAIPHPAPLHLRNAQLETVVIGLNSPIARHLIGEIELRTKTGASVVGIQRGELTILSPGPDEELQPGDELFLLGTPDQRQAARQLLAG